MKVKDMIDNMHISEVKKPESLKSEKSQDHIKRHYMQYDKERSDTRPGKDLPSKFQETKKRLMELIEERLQKHQNKLAELSSPKIDCSCRPLEPEEEAALKVLKDFDKAIYGTTSNSVRGRENRKLIIEAGQRAGQYVEDIRDAHERAIRVYNELSEPIWINLKNMKDERESIREQLADLREQKERLELLQKDTEKKIGKRPSLFHALKRYNSRSDKGKSLEDPLLNELSALQSMLKTVNALIRRAHNHKKALNWVIKKGHHYLLGVLTKMRVETHSLFLPQQMESYRLEEGKQLFRYESYDCGPNTLAMVMSDIDPTYASEEGVRKVYKKHIVGFGGGNTMADEGARVLNSLQDVIIYKSPFFIKKADLRKALTFEYKGKKVAAEVQIGSRKVGDPRYNHSVVVNGIKRVNGTDYLGIRDIYNPMPFRVRLDDFMEVWRRMGTIPVKVQQQTEPS